MRLRVSIAFLCLAFALQASVSSALAVSRLDVTQVDDISTSVAISQVTHPSGAPALVLAVRDSWRSQLAGAGLAGSAGGPLLITQADTITASIAEEMRRLAPARIYLLAAPSVSTTLTLQLRSALPAAELHLIDSAIPTQTARAVAQVIAEGSVPATRAIVVSPVSWTTAISAAAPAAAAGCPILFADDARPAANAEALSALGVREVSIIGDTAAVSSAEESALKAVLGAGAVKRIGAGDRYAVAREVNRSLAASVGAGYQAPVVVSGSGAATATLAGILARRNRSVLLLAGSRGVGDGFSADLFEHRDQVLSMAFVGSAATLSSRWRADALMATRARTFSASRAMAHVKYLAGLGPRRTGGWAEKKAAQYVARQLRSYGYAVETQTFRIPGGRTSINVIAQKVGETPGVIVLGGHMDTKYPSPGANDNASGVGVTLELARCLAEADDVAPTVRFVGFGSEEISGSNTDHHLGSRHYVATLSSRRRRVIQAAVSIDMVGRGSALKIRNMKVGPMSTVSSIQSWGRYTSESLGFLRDPSRDGWSDHEAFEFKGIPAAWVEWRDDPDYHTARDRYSKISADKVGRTGRLMRGWLLHFTPEEVYALRR